MNLFSIKCIKFTNNNNIKIKREIEGKTNLYSYCNYCNFKQFETIDEEKLNNLLESLNYI